MSYLLIIAAAGATFLSGPRSELSGEEAVNMGINLIARNFEYELMDEPAPIFLQLDLSQFQACEILDVGIDVKNESGAIFFGAEISSMNGSVYAFRLEREYLSSTDLAIACDSGPDVLNHVYLFKLGELLLAI